MADAKPTIEAIRARWARASRGPWRQGSVERYHVYTPDGATMGPERVLLRMNEHFAYEADADAIAHAPSDIAWLLERDAAREKRIAELEAELATVRMQVTDFADDVLGLQDVVSTDELLSRVAKWIFGLRQERARFEAELKHAEARIAELNEHLAQYAGEPPHAELVADLAGIRERARAVIKHCDDRAKRALDCGADPDEVAADTEPGKVLVRHVVGNLGGEGNDG